MTVSTGRARGLVAVAAAALLLTACSSNSSSSGSASGSSSGAGKGIVTANSSEPQNPLVPSNTNEEGGTKIIQAIDSGLVYYDAKGAPHNDLAQSISSSDQINYTIAIKSGQKWSDGSAVTAKNFVDAWNYGALSTNAQLLSSFYAPIEGYDAVSATPPTAKTMSGLKVVDDTHFTVKLARPQADFPLQLGYIAFYPLPDKAFTDIKAFGQDPIADGPYMLQSASAWQHNTKIDLVPNPNYTGPRKPHNGGLTLTFYQTQEAAYNDLLAGSLDVLDAVPPSALGTFQKDLGDRAVNQPAAIFQSFTIPEKLAHFSGAEGALRRQAISYAIDRPTITKAIFKGTRTPAKDFTSPTIAGFSGNIPGNEVLTYNADKAKQLWAQANAMSPWSGKFTLAYNADGGHQAWVDAVCNGLKNVLGIQAEGKPYPTFSALRKDITARTITGAFRSGWQADYPGLYDFIQPLYYTKASSNDGDYSNPALDKLINDAASAKTLNDSNKLLNEAQSTLFKDLPAIPLWYSNVSGGSSQNVSNVAIGWDSIPLYYAVNKK
ncbi:MAG TPA: ABC transporter substrate-binding protein [Blastococcus sp.]|nr:ABC transporter substrate-binding protein [Blastococcus sp.]